VGVTAVVLAAGFSRRFGSPKQLFEIDGEALVHRAARVARAVAPTVVVIPRNALAIREALRDLEVDLVENDEADEGIASSIRAGVRSCEGDVLLTVCDQPGVTSAHLQNLIDTSAPIAASAYAGTVGVPALFSSMYRHELLALRGDAGAKALLSVHAAEVRMVPLADGGDIDLRIVG
jgi:molybdenum cofactor cytidylyltransferase